MRVTLLLAASLASSCGGQQLRDSRSLNPLVAFKNCLLALTPASFFKHSGVRSVRSIALAHVRRTPVTQLSDALSPVTFVNPLDYDGFAEPGGWGTHANPSELPLLYFLPGMDGSICTAFMQYPELGTCFELRCMRVAEGMESRASFNELTKACVAHISDAVRSGRRILLVGESFGASLAIAVAHGVQEQARANASAEERQRAVAGLVIVNPATSYERSALAAVGPIIASLSGALLPLYPLALLVLAALVLTPASQAPAMISMVGALKSPSLLCSAYREAYLGRVALSAFLGNSGPGLTIGEILSLDFFKPEAMRFRLSEWLKKGAAKANILLQTLDTPTLTIVGDTDRLLPSLDEASRLTDVFEQRGVSCGTVVVPGAGHASTLGNRLDLMSEIRRTFGKQGLLELRPEEQTPQMPPGEEGNGWDRGMLDRPYSPIDPEQYTQYNKGGDLWPGTTSQLG